MTIKEYAARDARIVTLQAQLFDHTGHVRKGQSRDDVKSLIDQINFLRERNGWPPLDMAGRWIPRGEAL